MKTASATRPPNLLLQGLLIVFPSLILAGVGLVSLRQDRALARVEAADQAQQIANRLALQVLPDALKKEVLPGPTRLSAEFGSEAALADVVTKNFHQDDALIVCVLNRAGELIYPPRFGALPPPVPLDSGALDDQQLTLWRSAEEVSFKQRFPAFVIERNNAFLNSEPPARFAAIAKMRVARSLERVGRVRDAQDIFESVASDYGTEVSETGLRVSDLATLQVSLISQVTGEVGDSHEQHLHELCARHVMQPSSLSENILSAVETLESDFHWRKMSFDGLSPSASPQENANGKRSQEFEGVAARWTDVWSLHTSARRMYRSFLLASGVPNFEDVKSTELKFGGDESWQVAAMRGEAGEYWLVARRLDWVKQLIRQTIRSRPLPEGFSVSVLAGGNELFERPLFPPLASAAGGDNAFAPEFLVNIYLTDPTQFYARQQTRSVWFGSLIGISAIAVMAGFFTAWRSFRNQNELSDLKTNFVSSVSHELRSPIASVSLMAEELQDMGPEDVEQSREYHQFIVKECRRLSALIENVLDYSRIEQGKKEYEIEPTDLSALAEQTMQLLEAYASEARVRLELKIVGTARTLELDGSAVQQVLVNLADNAIKHAPENSLVLITLVYGADNAELSVSDEGPGIPPSDHERIFERFYRCGSELRRETRGTGLGLAIVKHVVDAHDGEIFVESSPGKGSRFVAIFPIKQLALKELET